MNIASKSYRLSTNAKIQDAASQVNHTQKQPKPKRQDKASEAAETGPVFVVFKLKAHIQTTNAKKARQPRSEPEMSPFLCLVGSVPSETLEFGRKRKESTYRNNHRTKKDQAPKVAEKGLFACRVEAQLTWTSNQGQTKQGKTKSFYVLR